MSAGHVYMYNILKYLRNVKFYTHVYLYTVEVYITNFDNSLSILPFMKIFFLSHFYASSFWNICVRKVCTHAYVMKNQYVLPQFGFHEKLGCILPH